MTVSLVLLISVLIAAIVLTVKSYEPSNVSQPGNVLKSQVTKSLNLQIMLGNIFIYLQIILRVSAVPVLKVAAKFIS